MNHEKSIHDYERATPHQAWESDACLYPAQQSDVSAASHFRSGEPKSMIFLQYQLKALNTAFRPGVQRPAIAILPNIHKLRDIKTREGPPPA